MCFYIIFTSLFRLFLPCKDQATLITGPQALPFVGSKRACNYFIQDYNIQAANSGNYILALVLRMEELTVIMTKILQFTKDEQEVLYGTWIFHIQTLHKSHPISWSVPIWKNEAKFLIVRLAPWFLCKFVPKFIKWFFGKLDLQVKNCNKLPCGKASSRTKTSAGMHVAVQSFH